jgi:predicted acyl esterase
MISCTKETGSVSLPMPYTGADKNVIDSFSSYSVYVTMADGTRLATDIFIPESRNKAERYPVILSYTPYQRARIDRDTGKISDLSSDGLARFLLFHGYVLVSADIRGTGASTGWLLDFMPAIWSDGRQLVDWIAEQPWSNGNVGMMGGSYLGWSQTATASQQPKALKCIMPAVVPLEGYTGEVYPGGIYLDGFMKSWSQYQYLTTRNYYLPDVKVLSKPVIDEDGDGELVDEIPLDVNKNGTFLDDGFPPTYADHSQRDHIYFNLTSEHDKKNYDYTAWTRDVYFYDARSPLGFAVYELGPTAHVRGIMDSGIPIYHIGGWFDGFARGSFELFETLKKTNPSKIIMGPGYHDYSGGPFWSFFGLDKEKVEKIYYTEHLRFFDRYLKNKKNGIDEEPPILIYVMNGSGWRFENEWPLKRQQPVDFYLAGGNRLSMDIPTPEKVTYRADFTHSSVYGSNGGNRWLGIAANEPDSLPYRNKHDKKALIFETTQLASDMEVTGHPLIRLFLSSTADYGDFFVYLSDVDPAGNVLLVSEGQLRAGFAACYDNDTMIKTDGGIDVLPDLPWHGYEKNQYQERILAENAMIDLLIDFHPTAWVFKKGHQIRVSLACADAPTFRLHPKLAPHNKSEDPANIIPEITVHTGPINASRLTLPVIPEN